MSGEGERYWFTVTSKLQQNTVKEIQKHVIKQILVNKSEATTQHVMGDFLYTKVQCRFVTKIWFKAPLNNQLWTQT